MRNLEFVNCSVVKLHEIAQTFAMVGNVMQETAKKSCKHGRYVSF